MTNTTDNKTSSTASNSVVSKQDMLMGSLKEFFSVPEHLGKMIPILTQKSKISLRLLDWFVTNYAKKKNIAYFFDVKEKNGEVKQKYFNVFLKYKSQLKAYSKQQFDPFCRKWKIVKKKKIYCGIHFYYKKDHYVETTVGQLNFFRWVIANKVLDYTIEHLTEIQRDMLLTATKKKGKGSETTSTTTEKTETKESEAPQVNKPVSQTVASPPNTIEKLGSTKGANSTSVSVSATKKTSNGRVSITVDFS
jgi:hypothetical protein